MIGTSNVLTRSYILFKVYINPKLFKDSESRSEHFLQYQNSFVPFD